MPQNTTININADTWTQITSSDVTSITFQNIGGYFARVKATVGATAPVSVTGSIRYNPGQGERAIALADLFPGISGANRLWVYAETQTSIFVSHA